MSDPSRRIVYVSCCENGLFGLERLLERGYADQIAVVTIAPAVGRRARVSGYVDFSDVACRYGLPIRVLETYKLDDAAFDWVRGLEPDVLLVNGWNRLLPESVLGVPERGSYGVHAGHPPRGRGRAPLAWTLIQGLRELDVYLFELTPNADDGAIVGIQRVEVTLFDNARTLYDKIALAICFLYDAHLPELLAGGGERSPQDHRWATFNPKRSAEDGLIDWKLPAERLYDFIRAQCQPYPGAFTRLGEQTIRVWAAIPFDRMLPFPAQTRPGTILEVLPSGAVIATGTTPILLTQVTVNDEEQPRRLDQWRVRFPVGHRLETSPPGDETLEHGA